MCEEDLTEIRSRIEQNIEFSCIIPHNREILIHTFEVNSKENLRTQIQYYCDFFKKYSLVSVEIKLPKERRIVTMRFEAALIDNPSYIHYVYNVLDRALASVIG